MVHYLFFIKRQRFQETRRLADLVGCFFILVSIPILFFLTRVGGARLRDPYFYKEYRGLPLALVESYAEKFWRKCGPRYENTEVIELLRSYKTRNFTVVIVSGSLRPVVQAWNAVYALADDIISTELTCNGIRNLTGRIKGQPVVEEHKQEAIENYEHSRGLNIQTRICLSDSYEDLPLLNYATDPIVVNPGRRLRKHANKNGWKTITSAST